MNTSTDPRAAARNVDRYPGLASHIASAMMRIVRVTADRNGRCHANFSQTQWQHAKFGRLA
jgi:hypothetical protein